MAFLAQGPQACPTSQTPKATASLHPAVSYFRQTLFLCKFLDLSAFGLPERSPAGLVAAASQWSEDVMAALWGTQVCPHGPPGGVRRARCCCCLRAGVWGAPPAVLLGWLSGAVGRVRDLPLLPAFPPRGRPGRPGGMWFLPAWKCIYLVTEESGIECTYCWSASANAGSCQTSATKPRLPGHGAEGLWGSDSKLMR